MSAIYVTRIILVVSQLLLSRKIELHVSEGDRERGFIFTIGGESDHLTSGSQVDFTERSKVTNADSYRATDRPTDRPGQRIECKDSGDVL